MGKKSAASHIILIVKLDKFCTCQNSFAVFADEILHAIDSPVVLSFWFVVLNADTRQTRRVQPNEPDHT